MENNKHNFIAIGNDKILRLGIGMSKMGTNDYHSSSHIRDRFETLEYFTNFGKIFVDTASLYGNGFSETEIGKNIFLKRKHYFLSTKFYPDEKKTDLEIIESVNNSLKRLKTDYVDLLQIHWPNTLFGTDRLICLLELIKEKALAKYIGVCNYEHNEILELNKGLKNFQISTNQIEFNLVVQSYFNKQILESNSYINLAFSVLNQGRLAANNCQLGYVDFLSKKYKCKKVSIILAWALSYEKILPLVKVSSLSHAKELLKSFKLTLTSDELNYLESLSNNSIKYIDLKKIKLVSDNYRKPYFTKDQALANKDNLIPSPYSLAKRFKNSEVLIPLKVFKKNEEEYIIDEYDPIGQSKLYWSWVIAFPRRKVPVTIINN